MPGALWTPGDASTDYPRVGVSSVTYAELIFPPPEELTEVKLSLCYRTITSASEKWVRAECSNTSSMPNNCSKSRPLTVS